MTVDLMKTIILTSDIYEEKDGAKKLVGRKGERVSPDFAKKHGVESAQVPAMESKVSGPTDRQDQVPTLNKRLFQVSSFEAIRTTTQEYSPAP